MLPHHLIFLTHPTHPHTSHLQSATLNPVTMDATEEAITKLTRTFPIDFTPASFARHILIINIPLNPPARLVTTKEMWQLRLAFVAAVLLGFCAGWRMAKMWIKGGFVERYGLGALGEKNRIRDGKK